MLIRCPILSIILIFKHAEVALVTALSDVMFLKRLQHGTTRFVGMGAVGEPAILREVEDLLEIAREFLALHIEGAEALDARSIDQPSPTLQRDHLREGRGVLSRVMGIRNLGSAQVSLRHQAVDECGLPHPAVATEQGDLPFD